MGLVTPAEYVECVEQAYRKKMFELNHRLKQPMRDPFRDHNTTRQRPPASNGLKTSISVVKPKGCPVSCPFPGQFSLD